jgi:hypothetical protein
MTLRISLLLTCLLVVTLPAALAQDLGQRPMLEDSIQARYRLTILGGGPLGIRGGDNAIRRVGGIVVLMQDGFYGSFTRTTQTANAIQEGKLSVLTGAKEVAILRGEKFYVTSASVGSDVVTLGLLSTRMLPGPRKPAQVWATASFFFAPDTLAQGDLQKIYAAIDPWIQPEAVNSGATAALPLPPAPAAAAAPAASPSAAVTAKPSGAAAVATATASSPVELKPGMTHDEIVNALGPPLQDVTFGDRRWLTYPGITVALEKGQLTAADRNAQALVPMKISSDPTGADVFLDGSFVSTTPALLRLQAGTYKIAVKMSGYADWEREVKVLPGAEVSLDAKLSK